MRKIPNRLSKQVCAALLLSAMVWPSSAAAELSLTCIYRFMTSVRVAMDLCGDQLHPANDAAFQRLRTDLKKFINENARRRSHRIEADYDEQMQRNFNILADIRGKASLCGHQDHVFGKKLLSEMLQPESAPEIRKRLETPADPSKGGDCS